MIKNALLFKGIAMVLFGLFLMLALVFFAWLPEEEFELYGKTWKGIHVSGSIGIWLFVMLLPIFFLEGGLLWIRRSRTIGNIEDAYPQSIPWSKAANFQLFMDIFGTTLTILLLVALLGIALNTLYQIGFIYTFQPTRTVKALFAVMVLYPFAHFPIAFIGKNLENRLTELTSSELAHFRLVKGGIEIDLGVIKPKTGKPARFRLGFNELQEIRAFTFVEAQAFLKYKVGPDVNLAIRQSKDLCQYYRDEIPRPRVYTLSVANSVGTNILIRGGELFYMLGFTNEDANRLIQTFENSRKKKNCVNGILANHS